MIATATAILPWCVVLTHAWSANVISARAAGQTSASTEWLFSIIAPLHRFWFPAAVSGAGLSMLLSVVACIDPLVRRTARTAIVVVGIWIADVTLILWLLAAYARAVGQIKG